MTACSCTYRTQQSSSGPGVTHDDGGNCDYDKVANFHQFIRSRIRRIFPTINKSAFPGQIYPGMKEIFFRYEKEEAIRDHFSAHPKQKKARGDTRCEPFDSLRDSRRLIVSY